MAPFPNVQMNSLSSFQGGLAVCRDTSAPAVTPIPSPWPSRPKAQFFPPEGCCSWSSYEDSWIMSANFHINSLLVKALHAPPESRHACCLQQSCCLLIWGVWADEPGLQTQQLCSPKGRGFSFVLPTPLSLQINELKTEKTTFIPTYSVVGWCPTKDYCGSADWLIENISGDKGPASLWEMTAARLFTVFEKQRWESKKIEVYEPREGNREF